MSYFSIPTFKLVVSLLKKERISIKPNTCLRKDCSDSAVRLICLIHRRKICSLKSLFPPPSFLRTCKAKLGCFDYSNDLPQSRHSWLFRHAVVASETEENQRLFWSQGRKWKCAVETRVRHVPARRLPRNEWERAKDVLYGKLLAISHGCRFGL